MFEDTDDLSVIPPSCDSIASKGVFSDAQVQTLLELCRDMVDYTPIARSTITERLI